ncbi:hypothetical protein U9M48_027583 [Paspalum notatum var. saurae]|uniref:Uncharacterized protein n=1 Tax=Paspalum notatum var. saurae TaxID=547442 RepID=A0AAQ3X093_PASNO
MASATFESHFHEAKPKQSTLPPSPTRSLSYPPPACPKLPASGCPRVSLAVTACADELWAADPRASQHRFLPPLRRHCCPCSRRGRGRSLKSSLDL